MPHEVSRGVALAASRRPLELLWLLDLLGARLGATGRTLKIELPGFSLAVWTDVAILGCFMVRSVDRYKTSLQEAHEAPSRPPTPARRATRRDGLSTFFSLLSSKPPPGNCRRDAGLTTEHGSDTGRSRMVCATWPRSVCNDRMADRLRSGKMAGETVQSKTRSTAAGGTCDSLAARLGNRSHRAGATREVHGGMYGCLGSRSGSGSAQVKYRICGS